MADELVYPENLSRDLLKSILSAAYMDVTVDGDGDILVKDTTSYRCYVFPDQKGRWIRLMTSFSSASSASLADKLVFVNKVNDELVLARAYVTEKGGVAFDYHVPVEGGITKRNIVLSLKRYLSVLDSAIRLDVKDVIA